jgi:hypothetical protein
MRVDTDRQQAAAVRETLRVRPWVIALALLLSALVSVAAFYADLLYFVSGRFTAAAPATAPLVLVFLLAAVGLVAPLGRLLRLTRAEVLATYAIVTTGAPLVSHGILGYLLPHVIYPQFATATQGRWLQLIIPLLPHWFSPTDPPSILGFFQGDAAVPWSAWWIPLGMWCSFLVALTAASVCLVLLLRAQWITHERLSFPLAQIPLELVQAGGSDDSPARLPHAAAFWVGLGLASAVSLWNSCATLLPMLPLVPLGPTPLVNARTGPLVGLGGLQLTLWPWLIGIAYLLPKELSFSCWFFWLARVGLAMVAISAGASPRSPEGWLGSTEFPAFAYQGLGALVALIAWVFWRARRHLGRALRIAFSRQSGRADQGEPIPYRYVLLAFAVSVAWMVYFCSLVGCRLVVAVGLVSALLTLYLAWTWLRAETGLGLLLFPSFLDDMTDAFGNSIYRPREIVMIMSVRWAYFNGPSQLNVVTGNVMESLKIADAARLRTRSLFPAMAAGFLVSLVVGVYITLTGIYRYGFWNLRITRDFWVGSQVQWGAEHIFYSLTTPSQLEPNAAAAALAGAVVALSLGALRLRFWWWPLHPVGFLAANSWGMHWYYSAFFIGWLAKALITHYGGLKAYRQIVPLAIGLIAGEFLSEVVWVAVRPLVTATY